ncbi:unnamed protein product [Boreogadus saida]
MNELKPSSLTPEIIVMKRILELSRVAASDPSRFALALDVPSRSRARRESRLILDMSCDRGERALES